MDTGFRRNDKTFIAWSVPNMYSRRRYEGRTEFHSHPKTVGVSAFLTVMEFPSVHHDQLAVFVLDGLAGHLHAGLRGEDKAVAEAIGSG